MPCWLRVIATVALLLAFFSAANSLPGEIRLPTDGEAPCAGLSPPNSCPVSCFRSEPVCGADGVTYWCGCAEAMCAGTRVAKLGFCQVGNSGTASFPGQALLLLHILWLIVLAFSLLCGLF